MSDAVRHSEVHMWAVAPSGAGKLANELDAILIGSARSLAIDPTSLREQKR